jgi:hypothetical protein
MGYEERDGELALKELKPTLFITYGCSFCLSVHLSVYRAKSGGKLPLGPSTPHELGVKLILEIYTWSKIRDI